jgi:L-lactate dehydrogenase complex protein LldG
MVADDAARSEILSRISRALADQPDPEATPREYRGAGGLSVANPVEMLTDRLTDYRATVHQCSTVDLGGTVARILGDDGVRRVVIPPDLPEDIRSPSTVEWIVDDGTLTPQQLDAVDGVVTTCAVAIALTGTIVLDAASGQGRRALTLIPDYHLVIVHTGQIVPGVPDAVARLDPGRPLTWISGPSATSDIELNRIEGVHGPRRLAVLIVSRAHSE